MSKFLWQLPIITEASHKVHFQPAKRGKWQWVSWIFSSWLPWTSTACFWVFSTAYNENTCGHNGVHMRLPRPAARLWGPRTGSSAQCHLATHIEHSRTSQHLHLKGSGLWGWKGVETPLIESLGCSHPTTPRNHSIHTGSIWEVSHAEAPPYNSHNAYAHSRAVTGSNFASPHVSLACLPPLQ